MAQTSQSIISLLPVRHGFRVRVPGLSDLLVLAVLTLFCTGIALSRGVFASTPSPGVPSSAEEAGDLGNSPDQPDCGECHPEDQSSTRIRHRLLMSATRAGPGLASFDDKLRQVTAAVQQYSFMVARLNPVIRDFIFQYKPTSKPSTQQLAKGIRELRRHLELTRNVAVTQGWLEAGHCRFAGQSLSEFRGLTEQTCEVLAGCLMEGNTSTLSMLVSQIYPSLRRTMFAFITFLRRCPEQQADEIRGALLDAEIIFSALASVAEELSGIARRLDDAPPVVPKQRSHAQLQEKHPLPK